MAQMISPFYPHITAACPHFDGQIPWPNLAPRCFQTLHAQASAAPRAFAGTALPPCKITSSATISIYKPYKYL